MWRHMSSGEFRHNNYSCFTVFRLWLTPLFFLYLFNLRHQYKWLSSHNGSSSSIPLGPHSICPNSKPFFHSGTCFSIGSFNCDKGLHMIITLILPSGFFFNNHLHDWITTRNKVAERESSDSQFCNKKLRSINLQLLIKLLQWLWANSPTSGTCWCKLAMEVQVNSRLIHSFPNPQFEDISLIFSMLLCPPLTWIR